jgi:hypothetical protein
MPTSAWLLWRPKPFTVRIGPGTREPLRRIAGADDDVMREPLTDLGRESRFTILSEVAEQPTRRVSSAVFGNRHRLELLLALAAAGDGGVCVKDLADSCGVATSVFHAPLRALIAAGLVQRRGELGHNRRVFYAFTDVGAWTRLPQLVQDLDPAVAGRSAGEEGAR